MKNMRCAVVANCQARPVAELLQKRSLGLEIGGIIITHLASTGTEAADLALLRSADLIFAQFVTDQYHAAHLATSRLRQAFGERLVSWPNIYFRGQCPDLSYASVAELPRLQGPLRDYHLRSVHACWRNGTSQQMCLSMLQQPDPGYPGVLADIADQSLAELKMREASLNVGIADIIEAHWRHRRLFFTFNHPALYLLAELASRLLKIVGIAPSDLSCEGAPEPLSLIVPPVLRREAESFARSFANDTIKGAAVQVEHGKLVIGKTCTYDLAALIEQFYIAYDCQLAQGAPVKFSPGPAAPT
jgi:hypothetical protein